MASGMVIQGGEIYDGSGSAPVRADIRIEGERIAQIGPDLATDDCEVVDASGLIVTPGLIDLHVHVCDGVGIYSINPAEAGLKTGVTTMLDFGSTGDLTYEAFHRYIMPAAEEDVFALLHIAQFGCKGALRVDPFVGDLAEIRHIHVPSAVECINRHRDRILGTKVRLTANLADGKLENEEAGLRGAIEAAEQTGLPCMIHHKDSNISVEKVLATMRPGDVFSHTYHPGETSGFADGAPVEAMREARQRGIIFDVGHGVGSFGWHVVEPACTEHDFWPDTISTDIHRFCLHGPVYDLPTTMNKFLYLGMPMEKIVEATTSAAARAMRLGDRFGTLAVGRQADVTLLRVIEGRFELADVVGATRTANRRLVPVSVVKRGRSYECQAAEDLLEASVE